VCDAFQIINTIFYRRWKMLVKLCCDALPLKDISFASCRAALEPIVKRPAMNTRFFGCVDFDGIFGEAIEDEPKVFRRTLLPVSRDFRRQFLLLELATTAAPA